MTNTATKPTPKPIHVEISMVHCDWLKIDAATPDVAEWVKDHFPGFTNDQALRVHILETDSSMAPVRFGATISPCFDIIEVRDWFNENYPK